MVKVSASAAPGTRLRFSSRVIAALPDTVAISQCTRPATRVSGCRSRWPPAMSMRPAGAATDMACLASETESAAEAAIVSATRLVMTCQVAGALRTGAAAMVLYRSMSMLLLSSQVLLDRGSRHGGCQVILGEPGGGQHGLQPPAQRPEDELAHAAPVQAGRQGGDCRQARCRGQITQSGESLGQS